MLNPIKQDTISHSMQYTFNHINKCTLSHTADGQNPA